MRISNGIRKLEDGTASAASAAKRGSIKAMTAIKPKASWLLRKTTMTVVSIALVPAVIIVGALDAGEHAGREAIKAIKEA